MTILYITAFPPNQKTGGQFFSLNAIQELSSRHTLDLIYFSYPGHECEIKPVGNIHSVADIRIGRFDFIKKPWMHPLFTRRFSKKILKRLRYIASDYDILYFDFSQVAVYSLYIKHPNKILRMHDILCQKFDRKNKFLYKWVFGTEKKIVNSFNRIFVPSEKDVEIVRNAYGLAASYTNDYLKNISFSKEILQKQRFVFYGYWKRSENVDGLVWFVRKVLPLCKRNNEFIVIGGGLDSEIQAEFCKNDISYLGFVENPLDEIVRSSAVVVPLFQGAGVKVKVVDSFTAGTPVIGTVLAFEGLPDIDGLCFQANNEHEFANIIDSFQPISFKKKIELADFFKKNYDCHHLLDQLMM